MKKSVFILIISAFTAQVMFAQLKVASNGNVGVQLVGTNPPLSTLSIGGVGQTDARVAIYSKNNGNGLLVNSTPSDAMWRYGIYSGINVQSYYNIGIRGDAYAPTPVSMSNAYGVMGYAGNASIGYNYGVFGVLAGSKNGAGIVGTTNGTTYVSIPGIYAGYFKGNVEVIGTLYNNGTAITSDINLKKNIVDMDGKKSLESILKLNPIEYNLKQQYVASKENDVETQQPVYDEKSDVFQKKHYGLSAQELQGIYPDLVYKKDDGYLAVNYVELIPMLIQSIKVLNNELETLKNKTNGSSNPAKAKGDPNSTPTETDVLTYPVLDQNIPNPFNTSTAIGYYLPTTITNASIYVYDMNGVQLKSYSITERGKGTVTIQGSEFNAGMYLYALIADGKVIDTKRMILTK